MSTQIVECVVLECDNCKEIFRDEADTGFSIWLDSDIALEKAGQSEWYTLVAEMSKDKHYCPECYSINDKDELILKPISHE